MRRRKEQAIPEPAAKPMRYPELLTIKPGLAWCYPIADRSAVRNACNWIRRTKGLQFVTRSNAAKGEFSVRLKNVVPEEE